MGIVYYANYLVWFEVARTEFFRHIGLDYRELEEKSKIYLPVVEARCRYRYPIKYDDQIFVIVSILPPKNARINFVYEVRNSSRLCAEGETRHTFVNSGGNPIRIPEEVKRKLINVV